MYLGIDISTEQIKEATERAAKNKYLQKSQFILGDVGSDDWHTLIESQPNNFNHHHNYDIAWCMFAFHYFCDTETHCRNFFSSVSYLLKSTGKLILTFPSPYSIYNELSGLKKNNLNQPEEEPLCSVKYIPKDNEPCFNKTKEECLESFGIGYSFTLGDAVQVLFLFNYFFFSVSYLCLLLSLLFF